MKLASFLVVIFTIWSCEEKQGVINDRPYTEQTQELKLEYFDNVFISAGATAIIKKGDYKVIVKGDSTDLALLKTSVENKQFKYGLIGSNRKSFALQFQIFMPNIRFLNISSGSKVQLINFSQNDFSADISAGSGLNAYESNVQSLNVTMSAGSEAYVNVSEDLVANLSGGSRLFYKGSPRIVSKVSGGSIFKKE
jgi:hypothetical protein